MPDPSAPPPALRRELALPGAVAIGLAAMLGAGVFSVFAPAAASAGALLPIALVIAAVVAVTNAMATAQLAAQYPLAGGAYTFGRRQLGPWPGFAAGWMFVVGKTASCGAIALTAGAYLWPDQARLVAVAAVLAMAAVNLAGVRRTARAAALSVAVVAGTLLLVLALGVASPAVAAPTAVAPSPAGVLQAAGLLFFAFAGYARIATLGEEVRDPARTIPQAITIALGVVLALYLGMALVLLSRLGVDRLAASAAPLADLVDHGWARMVVAIGAGVACLGSLLALLAGISRTSLAMAREGDLPAPLARVSIARGVPVTAEVSVAVVVCVLVLAFDLREVIAFSSVGVLTYYLVANLSALTQDAAHRRYPRFVPVLGALGCVTLVAALPLPATGVAAALLAVGSTGRWLFRRRGAPEAQA